MGKEILEAALCFYIWAFKKGGAPADFSVFLGDPLGQLNDGRNQSASYKVETNHHAPSDKIQSVQNDWPPKMNRVCLPNFSYFRLF